MDLAELLAPIEITEFVRDHWQRRSLYIPGAPDKLAGLFDRTAVDRAVTGIERDELGRRDRRHWRPQSPLLARLRRRERHRRPSRPVQLLHVTHGALEMALDRSRKRPARGRKPVVLRLSLDHGRLVRDPSG